MAANLKLFVCGPPRLECNGEVLDVKPRKALAILVVLAVTRQPRSRDALATLFWPDTDQQTARASLRRTLYRLNQSTPEGLIDVGSDLIQIAPDAGLWTDIGAYRAHIDACLPTTDPTAQGEESVLQPECVNQLEVAVQLVQDDFLAGFTLPDAPEFVEWQFFEGEELRRIQVSVLEHLAHYYTRRGELSQALPHVRRRLAMDPLHEMARVHLNFGDFKACRRNASLALAISRQLEPAREHLRRALQVSYQKGLRPTIVNGLYRYGLLRRAEAQRRFAHETEREAARQRALWAFRVAAQHPSGWMAYRERAKMHLTALSEVAKDAAEAELETTEETLESAVTRVLRELQIAQSAGR